MYDTEIVVAFKSGGGAKVKHKRLTIEEFYEELNHTPRILSKLKSNWFSLAEYENSHRKDQNIKNVYGITIDFDKKDVTFEELEDLFQDYHCIIKTSYNHKIDKDNDGIRDRFHVILFYAKPISLKRHKILQTILYHNYRQYGADTGSCKASQPCYYGSVPNRKSQDAYYCYHNKGDKLVSTKLTASLKEDYKNILERERQAKNIQDEFNQTNKVSGERTIALTRYAAQLLNSGASKDILEEEIYKRNATFDPPLSDKETQAVVDGMYSKHMHTVGNKLSVAQIEDTIASFKDRATLVSNLDSLIAMVAQCDNLPKESKQSLFEDIAKRSGKKLSVIRGMYADIVNIKKAQESKEKQESLAQKLDMLRKRFRAYVYVEDEANVYHTVSKKCYKLIYFAQKYIRFYDNKTLNIKRFSTELVANNIRTGKSVLRKADTTGYNPLESNIYEEHENSIKTICNTYLSIRMEAREGSVLPLKHHVFKVLFPHNKAMGNFILDYIAHNIQYPGNKINYMPVVIGPHGIGKSTLVEKIMARILLSNIEPLKTKDIIKGYTDWLSRVIFIYFNDLDLSKHPNRYDLTNEIRDLVTDTFVSKSQRYVDNKKVINYCNFIAFANTIDCLAPAAGERRFIYCLTANDVPPTSYFAEFNAWIESHIPELYHFFNTRDLSNFDIARGPEFKETSEIIAASQPWPKNILVEMLGLDKRSLQKHLGQYEVISWNEIVNYIAANSSPRQLENIDNYFNPNTYEGKKLMKHIRELGFVPLSAYLAKGKQDGRIMIGGSRQRLWLLPKSKYLSGRHTKQRYEKITHEFKDRFEANDGFFATELY